jgi:hypothetical protein
VAKTRGGVRAIRFVVDRGGSLLQVCKLGFSAADASLYLFPYSPGSNYSFGRMLFPASEESSTVPFDEQESSAETPKLSIHESGQVHVKAGGRMVGPMFAGVLAEYRGEHFATVSCVRFDGLAPLRRLPKTQGPEWDLVTPSDEAAESGRLVFYANAAEPSFAGRCRVTARLTRPSLADPLFVGVRFAAQDPLDATGKARGVVVIAGWNALDPAPFDAEADHLFIVAGGPQGRGPGDTSGDSPVVLPRPATS